MRLADVIRRRRRAVPPMPEPDIDYDARRRFEERQREIEARLVRLQLTAEVWADRRRPDADRMHHR